ncbi:unnamed protein product, partial [Rotaria sp. Silwood1]
FNLQCLFISLIIPVSVVGYWLTSCSVIRNGGNSCHGDSRCNRFGESLELF